MKKPRKPSTVPSSFRAGPSAAERVGARKQSIRSRAPRSQKNLARERGVAEIRDQLFLDGQEAFDAPSSWGLNSDGDFPSERQQARRDVLESVSELIDASTQEGDPLLDVHVATPRSNRKTKRQQAVALVNDMRRYTRPVDHNGFVVGRAPAERPNSQRGLVDLLDQLDAEDAAKAEEQDQ